MIEIIALLLFLILLCLLPRAFWKGFGELLLFLLSLYVVKGVLRTHPGLADPSTRAQWAAGALDGVFIVAL
jgi:hypothetical protein